MADSYTDLDRLILERWTDVVGLINAHKEVQDHVEAVVETVAERVARWARDQDFESDVSARDAQFYVWRPAWYDKRKGESRVTFILGGFCPAGFRKVNDPHPYLWVDTSALEHFKVKEPERIRFAQGLRSALGDHARDWEAEGLDDADLPLGRYLREYDNEARAKLLLDPDALFAFCTQHLPTVMGLADVVDAELKRLGW